MPRQQRRLAVVEKAKAEGEVVLYTAWGLDTVQAIQKAFAKKYPFIKFEARRTGSERLLNIAITEHKQKIFRADLFSGSHLAMINHKKVGHLQKYVNAEQRAFPKEYKDSDSFWTAFYMDTRVLAYNTRMASRDELPKTYEELLLAKWKGKMAMDDADYILYGTLLEMMGRERGVSFMKRLAQQELIIRSGHSLLTQLLIAGEFPIYLDGFGSNIEKFKSQGAPIDWVAVGTGDRVAQSSRAGGQCAASRVGAFAARFSPVQRGTRGWPDGGQTSRPCRCRGAVSETHQRAQAVSGPAVCRGPIRGDRQRVPRHFSEVNP